MGLFSNTAVNRGIASLFEKKVDKNDIGSQSETVDSTQTPQHEPVREHRIASETETNQEAENDSKSQETESRDEIEDAYMKRAARAQSKQESKENQAEDEQSESDGDEDDDESDSNQSEHADSQESDGAESTDRLETEVKASETMNVKSDTHAASDLERTLFVKNVPYSAMTDRKVQKAFKLAFGPGVQSVRFRSIALGEIVPRKVGFIKQKLNTLRDSVNSYIVYTSPERVKEVMDKMNGFEFDGHHLFVDSAAKPRPQVAKRSVFIGNLSFDATEERLYQMFADCGKIENLRIVRDRKFNIGKGFAYIQFDDVSTVQLALMKNDQECDGRKLRVIRCSKNAKSTQRDSKPTKSEKSFKQKQTKRSQSGKPKRESSGSDKPGKVLEGERSRPGETPTLGRKRKPRHENGRAKRARKNK